MKKALHILKRIASLCLAIVVFASVFFSGTGLVTAEASALDKLGLGMPKPTLKSLSMKTARALAIEESNAYFAVETKIETKKANLESARKKIKLKQKSLPQFLCYVQIQYKMLSYSWILNSLDKNFLDFFCQNPVQILTYQ